MKQTRLLFRTALLLLCLLFLSACGATAPADKDPDTWTLSDFPGCFEADWEPARSHVILPENLEVTILQGAEEGPLVYVVAGVHGDEVAGWRAGNLLKDIPLRAGTLCILSPANRYGAEQNQRKTAENRDLNRNFPGDPDGCDAERIAAAIFSDIRARKPDLLLDLHEAREQTAGRDALGNSLICGSLELDGELIWDLLLATEEGNLCSSPFTLYGSPPSGSINRTATDLLHIPAITVETLRTEPLEQRVRNQLELAEFILQEYSML